MQGDGGDKPGETRDRLLAVAIARFARDGFRATSVAAIAREAGLGGSAAYTYFAGKDALFLAAVDEDVAGVVADTFGVADEPYLPQWPATMLTTAMLSLERHPLARRVLAGQEPHVAHRIFAPAALVEANKDLAMQLRRGQEAGRVRGDIDAEELARGLTGLLISLLVVAVHTEEDSRREDHAMIQAIVRTLHASVVAPLG